ncbi:MAG: Zn-dependent alcohol dehydrogenase [Burkholderiaceae bacterium]
MKAAVLREVGKPLTIEDVEIDKPKGHEVLIRTAAVGVCHSDLHFIDGLYPYPLPTVPGHESAGIVEAVGPEVRTVKKGDRVITCLSAYCGHCAHCLTGRMSLCVSSETRRGRDEPARISGAAGGMMQFLNLSSFAEQILTHEHACVAIHEEIEMDRAAVIGCAVMTGVGAVIHTAAVRPGETVAVIGCGGIGLSAINGAAIAGAGRIIAIDRVPEKLELAKKFGATDVIDASDADPVQAVLDLTKGGVDHAFEAIGLKVTAEQSFQMTARGGCATVIGMIPYGTKIEITGSDLLGERRLQGSMMGSNHFPVDMPRLVDFYRRGLLKLDELIAQRVKLEDINGAIDELRSGKLARSVVMFDH